jgi:DNA mismatch repair protein MutL
VERAYGDLLPDRSYPSYVIGLTVDPSKIDINIHPTKTEVKFVDEHALFAILRSAVKRSLGQFSLATELSFDTPAEFNLPPAPKNYVPPQPRISYNPDFIPFRATGSQTRLTLEPREKDAMPERLDTPDALDMPERAAQREPVLPPSGGTCLQVQGRYIVTALSSGLALIDQQRAHERVLYHRLLNTRTTKAASQTLMFPLQCRFSAADAEMLTELMPDLKDYGFEMSALNQTTFVVTATPADLKDEDLQALLDQMLQDYKGATMQKYTKRAESLCLSFARQMAVRAGTVLSQEEMQQLVADLFACPMAEVSPSGKRIITIVNPEDLLK